MAISEDSVFVAARYDEQNGDAAADVSEAFPGNLASASLFAGTLDQPGDEDWARFELSRESIYRFVAVTVDGSTLTDIEIRAVDGNGNELPLHPYLPVSAVDERYYPISGPISAPRDTAFLSVRSASGQQTGDYKVYIDKPGDYLTGTVVRGGASHDLITGEEGVIYNNLLYGGSGDDTLVGYEGNDTLNGQTGNNVLYGGSGDDRMLDGVINFAGSGDDFVRARTREDGLYARHYGGDGNDVIDVGSNPSTAWGGTGDDTLQGNPFGDDDLRGGDGDDYLFGADGDDTLTGGLGADELRGSFGFDTAEYGYAQQGITVSLWNQSHNAGAAQGDRLVSMERIAATDHDDLINGNAFRNVLIGRAGDDTLRGGGGTDRLEGGAGNDVLSGGAGDDYLLGGDGADVFVFRAGHSTDSVLDYVSDEDVIRLHGVSSIVVTDNGTDTFISFGSDQIVLDGVVLTQSEIAVDFI